MQAAFGNVIYMLGFGDFLFNKPTAFQAVYTPKF